MADSYGVFTAGLPAQAQGQKADKRRLAELYSNGYAFSVNMGIIYNKSAFKHGLTEADIEWAFLHPIRNGLLEDYENKYLLIGFDTRGNPIEVVYNRIDEERVNVFHAMKCRRAFLPHDIHNLV